MKYQEELIKAEEQKEEIEKMFKKFKKKKPKNLDQLFSNAHDKVFDKIDCLACANCCKTTSPIFRPIDVKRISKKMKMNEMEFEKSFLKLDEDGDFVLKSSPCFFLDDDNKCGIYEFRPQACREYPHTNRKRIVQILDLTLKNTVICPAVCEVVLEVNKHQL